MPSTKNMKYFIITLSVLFVCLTGYAQISNTRVIDFNGLDASQHFALRNPDRGFRYEMFFLAHNLKSPYRQPEEVSSIDDVFKYTLEKYGRRDRITLSQLYIYLTAYVGKKIDSTGLANIEKLFRAFKRHGFKAVLRFAYDYNPGLTTATAADIERHLQQLSPVLKKYTGVIHCVQAGFIGAWGEWHSSPIMKSTDSLQAVLNALMTYIPHDKQLMVRYPAYLKDIVLPAAWNFRIGFHNDYFCADDHKLARGNDYVKGTPEYWEVLNKSPYVLIDGEMPYAENSKWGLHHHIPVLKAIKRFRDHHYTSFSITHNNLESDSSNIKFWKSFYLSEEEVHNAMLPVSEDYFRDSLGHTVKRTAFDYIRDHLGYRIELQQLQVSKNANDIVLDLSLINRGFSSIKNARDIYFVLINSQDKVVKEIPAYNDPRSWQPYLPGDVHFQPIIYHINRHLNKENLPDGHYKLGLWIPDGSLQLKYNAEYAIRCANDITWFIDSDKRYGVNILGKISIEKNNE